MKNKIFWKLQNVVEGTDSGARLYIDGVISEDSWWGDEATPQQLRDELKQIKGDSLEVVINSPGGDVWAGVAMYDALKELDGVEVTVRVSGLAASIASVIAMAGDKIVITPGSTMMIHKASTMAWGNSDDMKKAIQMLETAEEGIVAIYVERTGQTREAVEALMNAETWMSAEKAVELGFANSVVKPQAAPDEEEEPSNLLHGNFAFSMKATKEAMQHFVAKVSDEADEPEVPAAPGESEKPSDSPTPEPNDDADEASDETPPAANPTDTPQPGSEEPSNKSVGEESKNMKTAEEIAATQVLTPDDQAPATAKPNAEHYLKTKNSLEDFALVLKDKAGESFEAVRAAWKGKLVENGLSDPDYFALPEPVVTSIEDAVKASGIYSALNHTGLDVFRVDWEDTDENADTSRAGGHVRGDTKDEQILDFDKRTIRAQYIYKYLVLNKEDLRENKSTGALLRFVLNELPTRVIREMERAAIIGDGRSGGNKRKITSFIAVKADVQADNVFATEYTPQAGESQAESVARARDLIEADGVVVMIAKKGYGTDARFEKDEDGRLLFPLGTKATDIFNVDTVYEPTWFNDTTDPDYDAYLVVLSAYKTVGDNSIESFTNFKLETNENEFLQEIYKGGALSLRASAVGIVSSDES